MIFKDRSDAGKRLGNAMARFKGRSDLLILALPRGGVPVAYEVAKNLDAPLDVFIVRKLGVPGHEELAMGAVASGGLRVLNQDVITKLGIPTEQIERVCIKEEREIARRSAVYRGGKQTVEIKGKYIILVDDGLATGSTMLAAIRTLRRQDPKGIAVAVPVSPHSACAKVSTESNEVICLHTPEPFVGVGMWYEDFSQTTDDEVRDLLEAGTSTQANPIGSKTSGGLAWNGVE